ncbi:hypothetical protein CAAN1_22S01706 [[Candida] anglica]|uniref:RRM domain-containing protein n=1 Tax=[Candida] anglica TaxID=148631 RepID=A0ABP0EDR4_9ASCO
MSFPEAPPHPSLVLSDPSLLETADKRVSFNQETSQWVYDAPDGKYNYNFVLQQWLPVRPEDTNGESSDEEENRETIRRLKRQKLEEMRGAGGSRNKKSKTTSKAPATSATPEARDKPNTGVVVSNLPIGTTKAQLKETFAKFGLVAEDLETGEPQIKLYYHDDDDSKFNGTALVVYYGPESVDLAVQMLDDTPWTAGVGTTSAVNIKVEPATAEMVISATSQEVIVTKSATEPASTTLTSNQKKLLQERTLEMRRKIADWDGDATKTTPTKAELIKQKIWSKTVLIKNMFRKEELLEDPMLELDLKEDIQEECDKLGIGHDLTKVAVYDVSGSVTVKFGKPQSSEMCVAGFKGRYFDGLKLDVAQYSGETLQSSRCEEGGDGDATRLDSFGDWLEDRK